MEGGERGLAPRSPSAILVVPTYRSEIYMDMIKSDELTITSKDIPLNVKPLASP